MPTDYLGPDPVWGTPKGYPKVFPLHTQPVDPPTEYDPVAKVLSWKSTVGETYAIMQGISLILADIHTPLSLKDLPSGNYDLVAASRNGSAYTAFTI